MNDQDTIISNMLKAATVENERLRAAERNYQAAHDLQDEKNERLRAERDEWKEKWMALAQASLIMGGALEQKAPEK